MHEDDLSVAVRTAIEASPCSLRSLAAESGVPASTLSRIVTGQRRATTAVAAAVADGLERWAERTQTESTRIRQQLKEGADE